MIWAISGELLSEGHHGHPGAIRTDSAEADIVSVDLIANGTAGSLPCSLLLLRILAACGTRLEVSFKHT